MEQGTDAMERRKKRFFLLPREGKFLNYLDDALETDRKEHMICTNAETWWQKRLEAVPHAHQVSIVKRKMGGNKI